MLIHLPYLSEKSATPPPASTTTLASHSSTPVPSTPFPTTSLTLSQYRFCNNSVKSLKKLKDAAPFLRPVDPVALNIPHYPTIIKTPMDFGTVERKVAASNPQKPDPNPSNPRYSTPDEFVADVRLVFENCFKFNGPDHTISAMGRRVEEVFERQVKNMPTAIEVFTYLCILPTMMLTCLSSPNLPSSKRWQHHHHLLLRCQLRKHSLFVEHRRLFLSYGAMIMRLLVVQRGRYTPRHRKICRTQMFPKSTVKHDA